MALDLQQDIAPVYRAPVGRSRLNGWTLTTIVVAALVAMPVLVVFTRVFEPSDGIWRHLMETVLAGYVVNTVVLMIGVGLLVSSIGVTTAWLVTMHRFPGSRFLEWALLLPLAVPAYVMAYVYTDLLEFAGPLQTWLRAVTGIGPRDWWFPEIRSLWGAIWMLGLVLYPYVYLLARAAFLEQSVCVLEISRTLGRGPWRSFFGVALPLARPAIVAGMSLALMETIADYGTVQYFGVQTFTTGIFRTWFGLGSPVAAAQLATVLLLFVALLIWLERRSRGRARYYHTTVRYRRIEQRRLRGGAGLLAAVACWMPLLLGFLVPTAALIHLTLTSGDARQGDFLEYMRNSFVLAGITAVIAVVLALVLAYGLRLRPNRVSRIATRIASLGYAVPGTVIAVGVLLPFAWMDNAIDGLMRDLFGVSTGLFLTGTIVVLIFAYLVRFLAVSFNTVEASLGKISPSMDAAARTLGHGPRSTLMRVHAPIMRSSLLTAALLVFVDVMKELPATLVIRPFNFDTLAVRVYQLASDERLAEASTAALTIVLVGIAPVVLLSRAIRHGRPGARRPQER
ncbi:MAG: iron ABC transporter permease [Azospirillaceae bacterium]